MYQFLLILFSEHSGLVIELPMQILDSGDIFVKNGNSGFLLLIFLTLFVISVLLHQVWNSTTPRTYLSDFQGWNKETSVHT